MTEKKRWFGGGIIRNGLKDAFSKHGKSVATEMKSKVKGSGLIPVRM